MGSLRTKAGALVARLQGAAGGAGGDQVVDRAVQHLDDRGRHPRLKVGFESVKLGLQGHRRSFGFGAHVGVEAMFALAQDGGLALLLD